MLPSDLLILCFQFTDTHEKASVLTKVCKEWNKLALNPNSWTAVRSVWYNVNFKINFSKVTKICWFNFPNFLSKNLKYLCIRIPILYKTVELIKNITTLEQLYFNCNTKDFIIDDNIKVAE